MKRGFKFSMLSLLLIPSFIGAMQEANRYRLVKGALVNAMQPKPKGLDDAAVRGFWKQVKGTDDAYRSLVEHQQIYPVYIRDFIELMQRHVAFSLVVELGLEKEKEKALADETHFGSECSSVKEYNQMFREKMDKVGKETFNQFVDKASKEAIDVVHNCVQVCDTFDLCGGSCLVNKTRAREISEDFYTELNRALADILSVRNKS